MKTARTCSSKEGLRSPDAAEGQWAQSWVAAPLQVSPWAIASPPRSQHGHWEAEQPAESSLPWLLPESCSDKTQARRSAIVLISTKQTWQNPGVPKA